MRVGAAAVIRVSFLVDDRARGAEDEGAGQGKAPGLVAVQERDVHEHGAVPEPGGFGNGVGKAEGGGNRGRGVGEQRERELVAVCGEGVLARGLGADGDQERMAGAELGIERLPGLKFGHIVGTPAAAEELEHHGTKGEEVAGADVLTICGDQAKVWRGTADRETVAFDSAGAQVGDDLFGAREAVGWNKRAGVGGDLVELGLEGGARARDGRSGHRASVAFGFAG